jgi:nitrate reductase cytochrome c-type subunit
LSVMIKRASGFNRSANDWEFLAIDGAMTQIEVSQKKGSCLECHVSQKARDFVYREPPQ